jgi:broad specificity phosphatase PhoE
MAERLVLVAHGATSGTRDLVFGDRTDLLDPGAVEAITGRVATWSCGPEPACVATAMELNGEAEVLPALAGLNAGDWAGRSFGEVAVEDFEGLQAWLADPEATPHGGESLTDLVRRVGTFCDRHHWAPGRNVAVVAPLVARSLVVHALGVGAEALFRIDLAPQGQVGLSRHAGRWQLQRLG